MLSVHGPRADGFHALTSLVVALNFGDELSVAISSQGADRLSSSDAAVPLGPDNLILKAAALYRQRLGRAVYFKFDLVKRIPMGAGLGGGSSNASTALLAMNALLGQPLETSALLELAAELGSDCPFFIDPRPTVMRGRGEWLEALKPAWAESLRGLRLALFRPPFGIETAWAYRQLVAGAPMSYEEESIAVARLKYLEQPNGVAQLLYNSFEAAVGQKYLAIPTLLEVLRERGVTCLMSGSGSCCFALLDQSPISSSQFKELCQNAFGEVIFWVETEVA